MLRKKAPAVSDEIVDTNRFRMVRKLADGGMGSVFEAQLFGAHGFLKTVAIKTIIESYSQNDEFVEMFIGEAKLVADLVHQNICQVYQLGKTGNHYYIAMEYVAGVNLKEFVDKHVERGTRVPADIGTFIISRVCRGLEYAHAKRDKQGQLLGVVHRDISPKNIMLSIEGEVKLTDFGVAKARNLMKDQEGEVLMGKVQYMSPEQAQYLPTDPRSDIFSLGVVMFELMTGQPLFGSDTTTTTLQNVVYKEIPPPRLLNKDIPPDVEKIILRAVERDLSRRYQSAEEMGYDLEYSMYHKGYGPTIVTLEKYMRTLFPTVFIPGTERHRPALQAGPEETAVSAPGI